MEDFKVGSVVELKSGGPPMTVEASTSSTVECSWFAGTQIKRRVFAKASLQKADEFRKAGR